MIKQKYKLKNFISQVFNKALDVSFGKDIHEKCLAQRQSREFMVKAGQTVRNEPTQIPAHEIILGVKLIIEEAFEIAEACGVDINLKLDLATLDGGIEKKSFKKLTDEDLEFEQNNNKQDLIEIADGIADLKYVAHGLANKTGISMKSIDNEVHSSNMSKFTDGYAGEDGKWIKGPSYRPADVKSIIEAQKNA